MSYNDSHDKDHDHDRSYENESTRDTTPMVSISLREYDKLKSGSTISQTRL